MTLHDIIMCASVYLDIPEDNLFEEKKGVMVFTPLYEKLTKISNIVYREYATQIFPLTKICMTKTMNGTIFFSDIDDAVVKIVSVKRGGNTVKVDTYHDRIDCGVGGDYQITYHYMPEEKNADELLELQNQAVERILALALSGEYCLIEGLYEKSAMFLDRVREALDQHLTQSVGSRYLPVKRTML